MKIPNNPEVKIHIRFHLKNGKHIDIEIPSSMKHISMDKKDKEKLLEAIDLLKQEAEIKEKIKNLSK